VSGQSFQRSGSLGIVAHKYLERELGFIYCRGDDVIYGKQKDAQTMVEAFTADNSVEGIIMTQKTSKKKLHNYGVVKLKDGNYLDPIVERPAKASQPSDLASYGRYLLKPSIFTATDIVLKNLSGGEFMLVDAVTELAKDKKVLVAKTKGLWLTTGDPKNHLKAQVKFGLGNKDFNDEFTQFLRDSI